MMMLQLTTVQLGLVMKIDNGMELTGKISSIAVAKRNGWTFGKTSRQALRDVNAIAAKMGREPRWSKKFGDESNETLTIAFDA